MEQFKTQEVRLDSETEQFLIRLTEDLHVKLKKGVWLGFAFGIGLGLAAIVFGLVGFVIFIGVLQRSL